MSAGLLPGGAADLTAVGLGRRPPSASLPAQLLGREPSHAPAPGSGPGARTQASVCTELRFGLAVLSASLAIVYLIAAGQLIGHLATTALVLAAIGLLQIMSAAAIRRGTPRALTAAASLNALLVLAWILSRTWGLPASGGPQPVGLLDTLCATGSLAITLMSGALAVVPACLARRALGAAMPHVAILLAVASLSALAAGHTHAGAPGTRATHGPPYHLYCRLL